MKQAPLSSIVNGGGSGGRLPWLAWHASVTWELLARTIPVDVRDALGLLAAGRASEYLSLVPEVTEIVIGRAFCWGRELAAIRA
jgi:hypothetical protein